MDNFDNSRIDKVSRRGFIKNSALAGTATFLGGSNFVFAQGSDTIRVGLIGCGGRGTGAGIIDCAESSKGIELVAMGDLFQDHIDEAPERIKSNLEKRNLSVKDIYKVTPETTFVGFDAYQKVIDSGVDMVILTTPPNFRPMHLSLSENRHLGVYAYRKSTLSVQNRGIYIK